jgi:adenosylcobinamide kinase/adenosylcobinamide-phosphate guanylyltransferase
MKDKKTILILGGARSGKSSIATSIASRFGKNIVYVATAAAGDEEMKKRIDTHRKERPRDWTTIEAPTGIGKSLAKTETQADAVILDCLTMLASNIIVEHGEDESEDLLNSIVRGEIDALLAECTHRESSCIVVSNEVGMGIVPENKLARVYRDVLGRANKYLAEKADHVLLMIAGIPVDVKKLDSSGFNF